MTRSFDPSRRRFLGTGLALGCSAAASPLFTPVTFAAVPGDNRLVVILLRGAMDSLDVVQPYGDKALAGMRPTLLTGEKGGASDLDGFYSLHPALNPLMPLWKAGELGFVHAVSTPYRDRRSHFDGQDLLENGSASPDGTLTPGRDGWLNRALGMIPGADVRTAFAVGQEDMLLLEGKAPVSEWSPDAQLDMSPQAHDLLDMIYAKDPVLKAASDAAFALANEESGAMEGENRLGPVPLARYTAEQLSRESRIAAFSLGGWDTHRAQGQTLPRALQQLADAIVTLKSGLGPVWERTTVVCVTEFGRTARENGSRGTDHGTGGAMILAGGAVKGGKVYGTWPGLSEGNLFEDRDLQPTDDMRRWLGWTLRDMFDIAPSDIESRVFPKLDMGKNPGFLA
ncbi:DUF1501 domain-containing protein [Paroceanicella profunda]|uniref:DUF1501 domain-containing protein n=1 Tax=Paroceanicella profunda TaxID=2579971 RepID=A0A5B8FXP9_9RHOB|nr:DUF1501 domain-containing protein [Paroceanicella profunda]QDL92020.1 DUF1501 domain-containing protein [Paroceanicella profunda]